MSGFSINSPQETYTLKQFIALKDADDITYANYSILERSLTDPDLIYAIDNVIYTYLEEMKADAEAVSVDAEEKLKYMYRPKLLAFDCYGSTETYFILMALNGICNIKEFDLADNMFYALKPSKMSTYMSNIFNAESEYISTNRQNLKIYET